MATRVMRSVRGLGRRDALQGARGVLGACDAVVSRRRRRAACRVRRPPRLAAYSLKFIRTDLSHKIRTRFAHDSHKIRTRFAQIRIDSHTIHTAE